MRIRDIEIKNFKGCKSATYTFGGKNVTISGANGSGKTTIFDAITWLLFGKDSLDNAKFEVRPLDACGKQIDNVEISVATTFDMEDGKTLELKKVQKQNWVKKRGTENLVLQGNANEYEVDGYPKSEKEFKEFVNGIVSDDLFKMLTNPMYFPNMPWKEQRAVVMKLASNVSDVDMVKKLKKFEPLLDELEKAPSTDDIKAKYQKSINELKKKQVEIPVRIDEAEGNKVFIDVAELELLKNSLEEQISEKNSQISEVNRRIEEFQQLSNGVLELRFEESELIKKISAETFSENRTLQDKIQNRNELLYGISNEIMKNEREISMYQSEIKDFENRLAVLKEEWEKENAIVFDENAAVCPTCHREFPEFKIESLKAEFEKSKAGKLEKLKQDIFDIRLTIENGEELISKLKAKNSEKVPIKEQLEKEIEELGKELDAIKVDESIDDNEEIKKIRAEIEAKERNIGLMNDENWKRQALYGEIEDLRQQLTECKNKISESANNVAIDERISELQAELKEVGVKIASQEKIQYLLDEFIKYKLNKISGDINSMFDGVDFKLFDIQLNGNVKEVCECTVNGIPYGSLNNGHRIVAGLQIIKALQKMYGVYLPIFIDNAESLNDFNIPDMNCQIIKLKVTDNKDLRIEVE